MTYHEPIELPIEFFYYYCTRNQKKTFYVPIVRNIFLLILTAQPNFVNAPLLYCWHWVKSFLTATRFHNFHNIFQTLDREQRKLILKRFSLENILSSLALETGTMNNNLIINSTLLQTLVLSATKILHHTRESSLWLEKID